MIDHVWYMAKYADIGVINQFNAIALQNERRRISALVLMDVAGFGVIARCGALIAGMRRRGQHGTGDHG